MYGVDSRQGIKIYGPNFNIHGTSFKCKIQVQCLNLRFISMERQNQMQDSDVHSNSIFEGNSFFIRIKPYTHNSKVYFHYQKLSKSLQKTSKSNSIQKTILT